MIVLELKLTITEKITIRLLLSIEWPFWENLNCVCDTWTEELGAGRTFPSVVFVFAPTPFTAA